MSQDKGRRMLLDVNAVVTPVRDDEGNLTAVRQTLISAGKTLNGTVYPAEVLADAVDKFEGVHTYLDHDFWAFSRSLNDWTGWVDGVEFEDGALHATRHFSPNAAGEQSRHLVEAVVAGDLPADKLGCSIVAWVNGETDENSGVFTVSQIYDVESVDDVSRPASPGAGWQRREAQIARAIDHLSERIGFEQWQRLGEARGFTNRLERIAIAESDRALAERVAALESRLEDAQIASAVKEAAVPAEWKADLETRLHEAVDESDWAGIIEADEAKYAATLDGQQRATQEAQDTANEGGERDNPAPRKGESYYDWAKRVNG